MVGRRESSSSSMTRPLQSYTWLRNVSFVHSFSVASRVCSTSRCSLLGRGSFLRGLPSSHISHIFVPAHSETNRQLIRALIRLQAFLFPSCKRAAKLGCPQQKRLTGRS